MVRHYDQDEGQPDAALHWDTIRPVLLKAFAKHGARHFSRQTLASTCTSRKQQYEVRVLHTSEQFKDHSGGITIDPELICHIQIPYNWE